jgi:ABC-type multidrug transport system permease subunit
MDQNIIIPIFGMLTGIIIPIAVFIWQYYEGKGKRETVLEISKNLNDAAKVEELLSIFDERKKEPIDYRRGGVITLFVGIGISLLGYFAMWSFFKAAGFLVGMIGVGILIAGYLYPNTGKELTNAVEEYEKK